jgi:hypothetical protein
MGCACFGELLGRNGALLLGTLLLGMFMAVACVRRT